MTGFLYAVGVAGWFLLLVQMIGTLAEIDFINQRLTELQDVEDDFAL